MNKFIYYVPDLGASTQDLANWKSGREGKNTFKIKIVFTFISQV